MKDVKLKTNIRMRFKVYLSQKGFYLWKQKSHRLHLTPALDQLSDNRHYIAFPI